MTYNLWVIAALIFVINTPFGLWRAGVRKFSVPWFTAVHAPIVLAICIRIYAGIPLQINTVPIFAAAFFLGQTLGGRLHRSTKTTDHNSSVVQSPKKNPSETADKRR